ncbi:unnamed protein product [Caenorhabditis angaria]|uniref:Uncharacterized protein n=1 Tax=Caenorhabditis angaria TaxID=860376 RepID=A0A9P1IBY3_9PELO|nr:unnamed protein product [Caenorhabditis angaria]
MIGSNKNKKTLIHAHIVSAIIHMLLFIYLAVVQLNDQLHDKTSRIIASAIIEVYIILSLVLIAIIWKMEIEHPRFRRLYPLSHIFVTTVFQLFTQLISEAKTYETMFTTYVTSGSAVVHLIFLLIELI